MIKIRKKIIFLCECGCGKEVNIGKRFICGHNFKVLGRLRIGSHLSRKTKKKISLRHKGRKVSEKQKKDISKKVKELWQDEEYRNKLQVSSKKYWEKKSSRKRMSIATIKRFENEEERNKLSNTLKIYHKENPGLLAGENNPYYGIGKDHHNWKGGISFEPYCQVWADKEYKKSIRDRDNNECQNCGITQEELIYLLSIHHIDYVKKNCKPDNLITLCKSCNTIANYDKDYWKVFYKKKIIEIIGGRIQ